MKPSIYAVAKALFEQHGFDPDAAILSAWYGSGHTEILEITYAQLTSRMDRVRHIPHISPEEAERMRLAWKANRFRDGRHHCPACEQSERLRANAETQPRKRGKL